MAHFDGPGRAAQCGAALTARARDLGLDVSAGVHIGECRREARDGPIFDIADALAQAAAPGEVCVSRTVVDLVPGSGLRFDDRGVMRAGTPAREVAVLALVSG